MRAATQQVVAGVAAGCKELGLGLACRRDLELRAVRSNLAKLTPWRTRLYAVYRCRVHWLAAAQAASTGSEPETH